MRIVLVRAGARIGGAERYNQYLIAGFKKYFPKDKLILLTNVRGLGGRIAPFFLKETGTKKDLLRLFLNLPRYLYYWLGAILKVSRKKRVDWVVLQGANEKLVLTLILRLLGFRVCWIEHGPFFAFPSARVVLWLYRCVSFLASKIIAVSNDAGRFINTDKLVIIRTGIDVVFPGGGGKVRSSKRFAVAFIGSLAEEKGVKDFVRTGVLLQGVDFLLVGDGPLLGWVKERVKNFVNFKILGRIEDVDEFLENVDLLFFPTRHLEGLSLSLLEAMGMGVPVVTRDVGGNRELVIHNKTGILFKNERPEELAKIILNLLRDKKRREAMGRAARARVKKYFSEERWVKEMRAVWEVEEK
jgi:glycosyltransferase involved in cell wall biosynthesis